MKKKAERLCVVMPVYNEEAAIGGVLAKWTKALSTLGIDYVIRPYNDGSKDRSLAVLREAAAKLPRIEVRDKENSGHGPTVLRGYREAAEDGFDWIFQIDSDDEMGPEKFSELWSKRADSDFLVGRRAGRAQALPRKIVSLISRLTVRFFYGKSRVWDVNAPYRLYRVSAFRGAFAAVPSRTFAPNVILTGVAARDGFRAFEMPVPQHDRTTGEVSIRKWKLLKAAAKSLWQTICFAEGPRGFPLLWSVFTFLLSLGASTLGGRSLWIDEIMRVVAQKKYSVEELLACKNLADFDSQSPIGYILWRPVQSVLGMEGGGFMLSAIAAAIITYVAICVVRRWKESSPSLLACAIIALNPLLVYYGGELWFYAPWAAAFAIAFKAALDDCPWKIAVAGLFFVALHFAGVFVWFVFAAVCCILWLKKKGLKPTMVRAACFAVPAAVCLPLYLKAQFAAAHLDSQGAQLSRLASAPAFLWWYFVEIFPSLAGAWWFGVAVMAVGIVLLFRSPRRDDAVIALSAVFGWIVYTTYIYLRAYPFVVARFWLFALVATLPLVAYACDRISGRFKGGVLVAVLLLISNVIGTASVLQMDGRSQPMRRFAAEIGRRADSVVFLNSYDVRPFHFAYPIGNGAVMLIPSYWEQGETVREQGLRLVRKLSPLTPVLVGGNPMTKLVEKCGWTSSVRATEKRTFIQKLAIVAHLFPEPNNFPLETQTVVVFPQESELISGSETGSSPLFLPGKGWRIASIPPQRKDQPFTPVLSLGAGQKAELKVYIPKSFGGDKLTLKGLLGRGKSAAKPFSAPLDVSRKGGYASVSVDGGAEGCYFLYPEIL